METGKTDNQEAVAAAFERGFAAAASTLQQRLGRVVQLAAASDGEGGSPLLRFDMNFTDAGGFSWFVSNDDATGVADLLVGGAGSRTATLTEMHLDALSAAFGEMLEHFVEAVNSGLATPLDASGVDMAMADALPESAAAATGLTLDVQDHGGVAITATADQALVDTLLRLTVADGHGAQTAPVGAHAANAQQAAAAPAPGTPVSAVTGAAATSTAHGAPVTAADGDNVVALPSFSGNSSDDTTRGDLSLLLNVPLDVTVELGKTERTVRDILGLNVGSIVELEKLAGDPLDIRVNGQVLARGEVVVIDEELGIRITDILSPDERLRSVS